MTLGMLSILLNHLSANEMPFEKLKPRLKLSFIKDASYSLPELVVLLFPLILGWGFLCNFTFVFAYLRGWLCHRKLAGCKSDANKKSRS